MRKIDLKAYFVSQGASAPTESIAKLLKVHYQTVISWKEIIPEKYAYMAYHELSGNVPFREEDYAD